MSDLHGTNPISDVANPKPIHRGHPAYRLAPPGGRTVADPDADIERLKAFIDTLPAPVKNLKGITSAQGKEMALLAKKSDAIRLVAFRMLRLVPHRGGALACIACHVRPYRCICCNGLKCLCSVDGVFRHWEDLYGDGRLVPIPQAFELDLMERLRAFSPRVRGRRR